MKRVLSLVLSLLLGICGCSPAERVARVYLREEGVLGPVRPGTAFADMVLTYPDPDEMMEELDRALKEIGAARDAKGYVSLYEGALKAYGELVGAASLAYVLHCRDVTDTQRAAEYGKLNGALYGLQIRLARLEKALMDLSGYHKERGAAYADAIDRLSRQDETMEDLRRREDELCRRYERLDAEYRLSYGGRSWSMAELTADGSLSLQAFLEALDLYQEGRNRMAGDLFLELVSLRKQMAHRSGDASYAAGQYEAYGRAYTPEQALAAAQTVKRVFAPLYIRLRRRCENDLRYLAGAAFREDQFLAAMERTVDRAAPGAGAAWRYMLAYGLYDSRPSEHKLHASFTTYLAGYRCPFLFTQWRDDASSAFTVIHEFGHFLSYYLNPEGTYYAAEDLDLAETDAQGFELLMLNEYDALFGRYAAAARLCFMTNAVYAILSGFMEDEFQQRAYALKNPTVDDLNRLYGQVAAEYGFDRLFGYEGREWSEIGHTFQFPFYYVSYGVSMLGAMALVRNGNKGYGRLLKRGAGDAFMDVVGADVLSEETIQSLAAWVESTVDAWMEE